MARRRLENGRIRSETSAFYVPPADLEGGLVRFPEDELRHITRSLRLRPPAVVEVLDGQGGCYQVQLAGGAAGRIEGRVLEKLFLPAARPLVSAALAVCRAERMKLAVEKLAELGCHRLITIRTGYVDFAGSREGLREKLRRVAVSALKQSRSPWLMRVEEGEGVEELIGGSGKQTCPVFCQMAAEIETGSPAPGRLPAAEEYLLVVGPEGGFTPGEAELIGKSGLPRLDLGNTRLRSETAAVAGFVLLRQIVCGAAGIY